MRLTSPAALRAALYLLVADGLIALHLGGLLGTPGLVVVGLAVAGSWWQAPLLARLERVRWLGRAIVGAGIAAVAAEVAWLAPSMLDAFTHLLVFLLLYRLYARRSLRDARDIAFLAFFMLVAVSPITFSVVFLGLFVVFLLAGMWMLVLRHLLAEADLVKAPPPPARPFGLGRDLAMLTLVAAVATLGISAALFFIIPRVGQAALPLRAQTGRMVSGFSERVELGAFGEIEADTTVVMRVHLLGWREGGGSPEAPPGLRWRGVAFDRFDGRAWTIGQAARVTLQRHVPVPFPVNRYRGGALLAQEIYLEPIGTEMIFGAPRIVHLQGRANLVTLDDLGNVSVPVPAARLRYTVESELERRDPRDEQFADGMMPRSPAWRARFLQLPEIPSRVRALAREVTAGSSDRYDAALRLTAYLSRELTYTRALQRQTALDPIEEFLFVQRAGNCEYFAAALAVMLRTLDIPARVVNGFQRGEWNPYGRYFMVRLSDAHSWVEVFVEGAGWVTLDASPRGGAEALSPPGPAALYLDALRMRWYRYVINWSLHDQLMAAISVHHAASVFGPRALGVPSWDRLGRYGIAGALLLVLVVTVARWRRAPRGPDLPRVPGFYERALRALACRGLRPEPGETAREFAVRARGSLPACAAPLARVTHEYERVRFGHAALTAAESAEVEASVVLLERGRG
ncbi:MAG TPA: DUF3488 and transglutaminase-like domain-containing protein [Methylomirabilota bacterium]|jgi:transglutaminase-like putative cysteine protease|nr:DUF3488 and transglutaminase-like domain-containing protein [Methylomirabilota bacterium]